MTLIAWRTYLEVCHRGSLSAAAEALGYSQSAVSRQIASLEQLVGEPLLRRGARGVTPTAAGEAFRRHARVVVNEADRAVRAARDAAAGGPAVPLAVGATPSAGAGIVPAALARLRASGADLAWSLTCALTPELERRVNAGDLDLAVVTDAPPGPAEDPRLRRFPVALDRMCVIVPPDHPAAGTGPADLGRFAADDWIEDNEGSAALLRTAAARAGFEPRLDFAVGDLAGKAAMVAAGHGIALVPGLLRSALRRDVVAVPLIRPPVRGIYATVAADRAEEELLLSVVEALRAAAEP